MCVVGSRLKNRRVAMFRLVIGVLRMRFVRYNNQYLRAGIGARLPRGPKALRSAVELALAELSPDVEHQLGAVSFAGIERTRTMGESPERTTSRITKEELPQPSADRYQMKV
jgi:hypothetical protein